MNVFQHRLYKSNKIKYLCHNIQHRQNKELIVEVTPKEKHKSYELFNQIAKTYDKLNIILSLGIDRLWRRKIIKLIKNEEIDLAVDLATGTGDMAILLAKQKDIKKTEGIDLSSGMIEIGNEKIKTEQIDDSCHLRIGDGVEIPYPDSSIDLITVTFGIRNFPDFKRSMINMFRTLKPRGKAIIMEFSIPSNPIIKISYLFYFRYILPFIGNILSGHKNAYTYLNQTVEEFPYGEEFANHLKEVGFDEVEIHPLTFGIASIYVAKKS